MRPSEWAVVFQFLGQLGQAYMWRQDDSGAATPAEVAAEINTATDGGVANNWGCAMLGDVTLIARDPAAWELVCDGTGYLRIDFPDLYAVLQPAYIDDADHFHVPNLINKFPRGSTTPGVDGGSDSVTLDVGQLPAHHHGYQQVAADYIELEPGATGFALFDINAGTTDDTGDGDPVDIVPAYQTLLPVILALYPTAGS